MFECDLIWENIGILSRLLVVLNKLMLISYSERQYLDNSLNMEELIWCLCRPLWIGVHSSSRHSEHYQGKKVNINQASNFFVYHNDLPVKLHKAFESNYLSPRNATGKKVNLKGKPKSRSRWLANTKWTQWHLQKYFVS